MKMVKFSEIEELQKYEAYLKSTVRIFVTSYASPLVPSQAGKD